jgi:hypothetical protein
VAVEAAEVAAGGRIERKNRIRANELANQAPIREVCRHTRGLGDFNGESRANASFSSGTLLYVGFRLLHSPHPEEKLVTNSSPKLGC